MTEDVAGGGVGDRAGDSAGIAASISEALRPPDGPLHLFDAVGIEIELMVVDAETLDVRPAVGRLLRAAREEQLGGDAARARGEEQPSDVEFGAVTWSNELVAHVVEMKSTQPVPLRDLMSGKPTFDGWLALQEEMRKSVRQANGLLARDGMRLLGTGMHPWMDPRTETVLWPHENAEIYAAFDKLFDCRSHGWANLQSTHINLPFYGDEEFGRLHAAVRVLLPLLPALAASSPFQEGRATGFADSRLEAYRTNSTRVPSLAGRVIPEAVFSMQEYDDKVFGPIRKDLVRLGVDDVLRPEFSNARGAIARLDRGAIEIRLLDVQEQPGSDLALAMLVVAVLRGLVEEQWVSYEKQRAMGVEQLESVFLTCLRKGSFVTVEDRAYLELFGYPTELPPGVTWGQGPTALDIWRALLTATMPEALPYNRPAGAAEDLLSLAAKLLLCGSLSNRLMMLPESRDAAELRRIYGRLADHLSEGTALLPQPDWSKMNVFGAGAA